MDRVQPAGWRNPVPSGRYNLVVIGGGTAGLVSAMGCALLGGKAALIERRLLGGDCLNFGCVPSKALLRAARAAYDARRGGEFGFAPADATVDFPAVMERMRRLRSQIAANDSAERLTQAGVDVYFGQAEFTAPDALRVAGQTLKFHRAVIATGSRPAIPDVPGLAEAEYLTNETIFSLTQLPTSLIVIGAGPIGCELAQAFRRFGSDVRLVDRGTRILHKESTEAAAVVQRQLEKEGVRLHLGWSVQCASRAGETKSLLLQRGSERQTVTGDAILVASGRAPNVEGLGLDWAGVSATDQGVVVNDRLRTANRRIYAAGDVCSRLKFTHAADAMARICVQNALFLGRLRQSDLIIPRCTYTDPELAHVGLTREQAEERGLRIESFRVDLSRVDRAVIDGQDEGFAEVHVRHGQIVGATVVAAHAGEMIHEIVLAMTPRAHMLGWYSLPLSAIGRTIHCYPTQSEVFRKLADEYARTRLKPWIKRLSSAWLAWRRGG